MLKYDPKEIAGFAIGGLTLVFIGIFFYNVYIKKKTFGDSCTSAFSCVCTTMLVLCACLECSDNNTNSSSGGREDGISTTKDTDPPTNPTREYPLDRV